MGRFAQADTIIPGGVLGYDRYAYVANNPLRYIDPTGHRNCEEDGYNCPGNDKFSIARGRFSAWWTGYGAGWGHPLRRAIAEKINLPKTASNLPMMLIHGMLHEPAITLSGFDSIKKGNSALPNVKIDPAFLDKQNILILEGRSNPSYGKEPFSDGDNFYQVEFGGNRNTEAPMWKQILNPGKYPETWDVAGNELTWMLRHASVGGRNEVSADGRMAITWTLYDVADLRPENAGNRIFEYETAVSVLGFI